jgi:hypothetical protein
MTCRATALLTSFLTPIHCHGVVSAYGRSQLVIMQILWSVHWSLQAQKLPVGSERSVRQLPILRGRSNALLSNLPRCQRLY